MRTHPTRFPDLRRFVRLGICLVAAVAMTAAIMAVTPSEAEAQDASGFDGPGVYQLVNERFDRYLASAGDGASDNVVTTTEAGANTQWRITLGDVNPDILDNPWRLQNVATGGFLDADSSEADPAWNVDQSRISKVDDEWYIGPTRDPSTFAVRNARFGRWLDADNAGRDWNVDLSAKPQSDSTWRFVRVIENACVTAASSVGMATAMSTYRFEETWDRLVGIVDGNPNLRIVERIDHAAAAADAGLRLAPNRVLVFGNPAIGTPLMQDGRSVGIDLPQKIQVWEIGEGVCVGYNSATYLAARHELGDLAQLEVIAGALAAISEGASGSSVRLPTASPDAGAGLIIEESDADFATTLARLEAAIDRSPASVFFSVDHAANSGGVLEPTTMLAFGNPNLGTPLMVSSATAGIDLPLKMLVWQDGDRVLVAANSIDFLVTRHGVEGADATVDTIRGALANFVAAATQTPA